MGGSMHKGNCNGKILVIQDAPSESDLEQGVPFTGPPGWKLKKWIEDNGISIDDIMFCNLDYYIHVDLASIQVIVPLGEKSTEYLLPGYPKLNKIRGSIYYKDGKKIIPSLHPKDVIFNTQWEYRCRADWKKIKGELENGIYEPPIRNHNITPDLTDIKDFYDSLGHASALSMDIETWGGTIKCIGFAANERESLVIPTEESYWKKRTGDELDIHNAWDLIQLICTHPCAKIMQNGLFDAWWLLEYGIGVENYIYDTLAMHHALWPRDNHSLDYLASIYTRQPYWKDEAKDADEIVRVAKQGMERLYVYNGLDVTVTWEIWQKLQTELMEAGLFEFYKTHYAELFYPLLSLMRRGISVDRGGMDALRVRLVEDALSLRDRASQLAGQPLFIFDKTQCERDMLAAFLAGNDPVEFAISKGHKDETIARKSAELTDKGISDACLIKVLEGWKLPKSATGATKSGRMKVDNISLRKIQKYYEDRKTVDDVGSKVMELVDITLDHRRNRKLASFLTDSKIDDDNRLRCTYKLTPKTGRLASSSNPRGTGMNLQNIDRSLRHLFTASKDRVLLEIDLSQAEARIVGALTGDETMIQLARRLPTEGDTHTENAVLIYSHLLQREITFEEITKEQRYLGKRAVHASGYGMRGAKLADILLKEGFTFTAKECQGLIDAYMAQRPAIRAWQSDVRKIIWRDRYLSTSWGRHVDFLHDRFDDETYRFAYAYVPQSEIGDLTNQWMIKPVYQVIKEHKLKSELILQCHDAIIVDAYPEEVWHIMRYVKRCVERPRIYGQAFGRAVELVVPCEYTIGPTWKHYKDWKSLPSKEEVADICKEILK
jgi:DNA polymerase I-like protein with 3'-5' exonuclease and polymerase domains